MGVFRHCKWIACTTAILFSCVTGIFPGAIAIDCACDCVNAVVAAVVLPALQHVVDRSHGGTAMRNAIDIGNGFIVTTDNSGGIGEKPGDIVAVPDRVTAYFAARVALLEQWASSCGTDYRFNPQF